MKCRFRVEIDGLTVAHFQGATGIGREVEAFTHQEGGRNDQNVVLPGQKQFGQLTLKRGYDAKNALLSWMEETASLGSRTSAVRKSVIVDVLGDDGTSLGAFGFSGAWPAKWTIEDLAADANEQVIETLVIEHEGFSFTKGRGDGGWGANGYAAQTSAAASAAASAARAATAASRAAASAAADAARGGSVAAAVEAAIGAVGAVGGAVGTVASAAGAGAAVGAGGPSALEAQWAAATGGAAGGGAAAGAGGGAGAGAAAVAAALGEGVPVTPASLDGGGGAGAGVGAARGFARVGGSAGGGGDGGSRWSDGVGSRQAAGGFGESGLPGAR